HSDDFVADPNSEISLFLKELEELSWFGFDRNGDPKCDKNIFSGALTQNLLRNRLRGFRANLAAAIWTEGARDARPQQFQVVVNLSHRADSRSGSFDGVRLFNGDCGRDAADIVNARLVHAIEELPHVWTERFDVTSLALSVNRLKCQA